MKHKIFNGKKTFLLLLLLAQLSLGQSAMGARVGVYCFFSAGDSRVCNDDNILTRFVVASDGTALLEVTNLTDNVVYIDRGNSFSYVNNFSAPLFEPTSSTESHTYGHGIIHGDSQDYVKRIEGESHTSSRTVFDLRIQPVAPHGTAIVYEWHDLPLLLRPDIIWIGHKPTLFATKCKGHFAGSAHAFRKGESRNYTLNDTPLSLTVNLLYAMDENGTQPHRVCVSDYVDRIVVGGCRGVSKEGLLALPSSLANCFAFRSGKSMGAVIGECVPVAAAAAAIVSTCANIHNAEHGIPEFPY